jgi:hypothetical protein
VEIHRSASTHGVSDDDVVRAVGHEMVSVDLDPMQIADGAGDRHPLGRRVCSR